MPAAIPQKGEVWRVAFPMPSKDQAKRKPRPALVVSAPGPVETGGVVTVAAISSSVYRATDFDIPVQARTRLASSMGLTKDSHICCALLYSFSIADFLEKLGCINPKTQKRVDEILARIFPGNTQ